MSLSEIADKMQAAVKLGDALRKPENEIRKDVCALAGHLSPTELDAVHRIIAADVAHDEDPNPPYEPPIGHTWATWLS